MQPHAWCSSGDTAPSDRFQYQPPAAAQKARRILVKPNLGYPVGQPANICKVRQESILDYIAALEHNASGQR